MRSKAKISKTRRTAIARAIRWSVKCAVDATGCEDYLSKLNRGRKESDERSATTSSISF